MSNQQRGLDAVVTFEGFAIWDVVEIKGLQSQEGRKLNKRTGTVVGLPTADAPDRLEVHVKRREQTVGVKAANLVKLFPAIRVAPDGRGGLGCFATRPIQLGETVLCETPIGLETTKDWEDLSEADRTQLRKLARGRPVDEVLDIICVNTFEHAGVCLVMSRANHSCDPCAAFEFDVATGRQHLSAVRDIAEGEEITVCYVSEFLTRNERRRRLMLVKSFECRCKRCTASDEAIAKDDAAVARVKTLYDSIPMIARSGLPQDLTVSRTIAAANELLLIIRNHLPASYLGLVSAVASDILQIIFACAGIADWNTVAMEWIEVIREGLRYRSRTEEWERRRRILAKWNGENPRGLIQLVTQRRAS